MGGLQAKDDHGRETRWFVSRGLLCSEFSIGSLLCSLSQHVVCNDKLIFVGLHTIICLPDSSSSLFMLVFLASPLWLLITRFLFFDQQSKVSFFDHLCVLFLPNSKAVPENAWNIAFWACTFAFSTYPASSFCRHCPSILPTTRAASFLPSWCDKRLINNLSGLILL